MSEPIVVDYQAPSMSYSPRENLRSNSACVACAISNPAALRRLNEIASGGTLTNAWWDEDVSSVAANLEFQGTTIVVSFIMFFRSMNPRSTGIGNLFIDDRLEQSGVIDASQFVFDHDVSPRRLLLQKILPTN